MEYSLPWSLLPTEDLKTYTRLDTNNRKDLYDAAELRYNTVAEVTQPVYELDLAYKVPTNIPDLDDVLLNDGYSRDREFEQVKSKIYSLSDDMDNEQYIPYDVMMETSLDLHPTDILSLCSTSTQYHHLCDKWFWCRKAVHDNILFEDECDRMTKEQIIDTVRRSYAMIELQQLGYDINLLSGYDTVKLYKMVEEHEYNLEDSLQSPDIIEFLQMNVIWALENIPNISDYLVTSGIIDTNLIKVELDYGDLTYDDLDEISRLNPELYNEFIDNHPEYL